MHYSCMAGRPECLKVLIRLGIDFTVDNKEGFSPKEIS